MSGYAFHAAKDLREAAAMLAETCALAYIVAGGTDVMLEIRDGKHPPGLLLDISRLNELRGIEEKDGEIHIGALTTIRELAESPIIAKSAPALHDAALRFADPSTRNRATIGGNIVNASPGADGLPPLYALDARVALFSRDGERELAAWEFITGPQKTAIGDGEILTGITIRPCRNSAFVKMGLRRAMAIAMETVAVALETGDGGMVTSCRVAYGALGPTPLRGHETEKALTGKIPCRELLDEAAEAARRDIRPRDGLRGTREYRLGTVGVILRRAFEIAYGRAGT